MKVKREVWIPTKPGAAAAIYGWAAYCSAKRPRLCQVYHEQRDSDRPDDVFRRFSDDNGKTWGRAEVIHTCTRRGEYVIRHGVGPALFDADRNRFLLFELEDTLKGDDLMASRAYRRIFYQVSADEGKTFSPRMPVVEKGQEFSPEHPMRGIVIGKTAAMVGGQPIRTSSGKIILPLYFWALDENGEFYLPYKAKGVPWFINVMFLIGTWSEDSSTLEWQSSDVVSIDPKLSTEGLDEPAVAELSDRKRLVAIYRGSNDRGAPGMTSHKWTTVSSDGGRTWTKPAPLCYSDGGGLYSSSSYSALLRHSNGKLYWIGNISPTNPDGMSPRYPLVIAEIDQQNLGVKRQSVIIVDTRRDGEREVSLSNFGTYEDRETREVVLTLPRQMPDDWNAPCMEYRIDVTARAN